MPLRFSSHLTTIAALALVALAASACGRRGGLEAPSAVKTEKSAATAPVTASPRVLPQTIGLGGGAAAPDPDAVRDGDELDPQAVPGSGTEAPIKTSRGARRGYTVPKQPFILDPLL
ncbi:hypothetical protein G3T14_18000 [Methylobacterium sp. BTF04]|uniref:hypothetical protein n=1 Tax=Methylobacterium sp. BTF04 TaxID=2708300 RepID=UPI0013D31D91|nr:hypothetical protein [Methylobacterium sp. BTF04]NEU14008.1 hypothetical protein [Methylobacterium sp. BTF04]